MFIYHFNRMIRNRFLWLIFGVVVAVAFLSVGSCDLDALKKAQSEGKVNGVDVSSAEYRNASTFVRLSSRGASLTPMMTETQIWAHIAALHTAEKAGISVSSEELNNIIRNTPAFQSNGKFSRPLFEQTVTGQLGIDPIAYREIFLRDNIILSKLAASMTAGALVSPAEAWDYVNARSDTVTFQSASTINKFMAQDYSPTEEEQLAYYEAHKADYSVEDRVSASYAVIPVTNYVASIAVSDEDIETYYSNNEEKYTFEGPDGNPTNRPLAEVRDEIRTELALVEANFVAETNLAAIIAVNLNNANVNNGETDLLTARQRAFDAWAKSVAKWEVRETKLVGPEDPIPGIDSDVAEDFRTTLHGLSVRPENENLFASVIGERTAYLLCARTNDLARTLTLDEVRDRVVSAINAERREKDFREFTNKLAADIKASMATNTFEEAAKALALNVTTSITFTAQTADYSLAQPAVLQAALRQPANLLSEAVPTYGGAAFVYVHKRVKADDVSRQNYFDEASERQSAGTKSFAEWMLWNLRNSNVESHRLIAD